MMMTSSCNMTELEVNLMSENRSFDCDVQLEKFLHENRLIFDVIHAIRISVAWSAFLLSFTGNWLVLMSVTRWRRNNAMTHTQTMMLHIALANLLFTVFVMPTDGIWQSTLQWFGGHFLCKIIQSLKQFSMYISSFMIATMETDRAMGLLRPASPVMVKQRLRWMLIVTWSFCFTGSIPAVRLILIFIN